MSDDNVIQAFVVGFEKDGKHYRAKNAQPGDEFFDHETLGAFNVTMINTLLRASGIPSKTLPITQELYEHCLVNGGVEEQRVKNLPRERLHAPITVVTTGPVGPDVGVFMVDGHHRVVKRWRFGLRTVEAFVCPFEVANDCMVTFEEIHPEAYLGTCNVGIRRTYFDPMEPRR